MMPFKRRIALHLAPIKTTLGLDKSDQSEKSDKQDKCKHHSGLLRSPFFSPTSPTIERPVISAQQEAELRNCLIRVLRDINKPSDQVCQEMFWKKKSSKAAVAEKSKELKDKEAAKLTYKNPSFTVAGPNDTAAPEEGAKRYDSGIGVDSDAGISSSAKDEPQQQSKAGLSVGRVASTDGSTVATDATRDVDASATLTGLTSAVLTPGDTGKTNVFAQGFSRSEPASRPEPTDVQNWMAQEFAKRPSQNITVPAPASSAQPPSSVTALTPTAESASVGRSDSKRRNTIAQTNTPAIDRLAVLRQDRNAEPATPKKVPWWRRASISRRKSSPSLRPSKSEGDTPATKSGGRTPNPNIFAPPLPPLDSAKWSEKAAKKVENEDKSKSDQTELVSSPKKSPSPTPSKKPLSPVQDEEPDEVERPGSAIIIDEEGKERELSVKEERKRDSDIQSAVHAKMLAGSLSSRPTTPALSTTETKSMDFPRPSSQQSAKSTRSAHSPTSPLKESIPAPKTTESPSSDKTEVIPTPKAIDPVVLPPPRVDSKPSSLPRADSKPSLPLETKSATFSPPRVDSKLSSPVDAKPTTSSLPKLSTVTQIAVPKPEIHSATPITPAQELEDPYGTKTLEQARTASPTQTKKLPTRGSSFLKRFSSLKDSKPKNQPASVTMVSSKELRNQRDAKMKAYGKMLETQYEGPESNATQVGLSSRKMLDATTSKVRSSSPTPSDLYAL